MDGRLDYPTLETVMEEAEFEEMGAYFLKRHNTVAQYITTRSILYLCEETVQKSGVYVARRWLYQELLDLAG